MRLPLVSLVIALFALLPEQAQARLRVVATVPDLAAIAADIGGDQVDIKALSLPTEDPHFVDPRPSLALALARADLLVVVGSELEIGWLPPLIQGSRNPRVQPGRPGYFDGAVAVSDQLHMPEGPLDRSMGDVHPGGNPHYLFDPRMAADVGAALAERMAELDPEHADLYRGRALDLHERIEQAMPRWKEELEELDGKPVLAFHESLTYLQDWVGFTVVGHLEPHPGVAPSPQHLATVLGTAQQRGADLVFQENFYPDRASQLVAQRLGGQVVVIPAGTDFEGGQGYVEHIDELVALLSEAL